MIAKKQRLRPRCLVDWQLTHHSSCWIKCRITHNINVAHVGLIRPWIYNYIYAKAFKIINLVSFFPWNVFEYVSRQVQVPSPSLAFWIFLCSWIPSPSRNMWLWRTHRESLNIAELSLEESSWSINFLIFGFNKKSTLLRPSINQ